MQRSDLYSSFTKQGTVHLSTNPSSHKYFVTAYTPPDYHTIDATLPPTHYQPDHIKIAVCNASKIRDINNWSTDERSACAVLLRFKCHSFVKDIAHNIGVNYQRVSQMINEHEQRLENKAYSILYFKSIQQLNKIAA